MKPVSPQLKYMRECRADPLFREYELERQRERRAAPEVKAKARAYYAAWKARRRPQKIST